MGILDYKIKNEDFNNRDIMGLPDKPSEAGMSAAMLKERFDAAVKYIVMPKLNALIEALDGDQGAANTGVVEIEGLSGHTVQEVLVSLKNLLDTKEAAEQHASDSAKKFDKTEAQALVKEIRFAEQTGIFTIIKYDGSIQEIDTALEKVALDVRLDGQQFVLRLADGTEQRVDLAAFLTQTEIKNSDTIALAEETGVLVARLLLQSVKREHLASDATDYLEEKERAAAASANQAAVQAENAKLSAQEAATSQGEALECANRACNCAANAERQVLLAEEEAEKAKAAAIEADARADAAAISVSAAAEEADRAKREADRARDIAGGDFLERSVYDPQGIGRDVFAYCDSSNIDCGYFIEDAVRSHNADPNAHANMVADANMSSLSNTGDFLEEHEVDAAAHQNIVLDGNR